MKMFLIAAALVFQFLFAGNIPFVSAAPAFVTDAAANDDSRGTQDGLGPFETLVLDVGGGVLASTTQGNLDSFNAVETGLVVRLGVTRCFGSGSDLHGGLMAKASGIFSPRGSGAVEFGPALCWQLGSSVMTHGYLSGESATLRVGNAASRRGGVHVGEIVTILQDTQGFQKISLEASVFAGMLRNLYYVDGSDAGSGDSKFAVGVRFGLMFRDLVTRIEGEGSLSHTGTTGAAEFNSATEVNGAIRWLAVRVPNTNSYLYVGLQGSALYARNLIDSLGEGSSKQKTERFQNGVQGLGLLGFSY